MSYFDLTEPVTPDFLPRRFTVSIPGDELTAVTQWAGRYAPVPHGAYPVDCCFLPGGRRRWLAREANVLGWLDFTDDSQPVRGAVTVPFHLLRGMEMADFLGEGGTISVDLDAREISARVLDVTIVTELPDLPTCDLPSMPDPDRWFSVASSDVAAAVASLRFVPVSTEEMPDAGDSDRTPWPFVTVTCNETTARFRRDWREFDHPAVDTVTDATGSADVSASFYPEVALREIYIADQMQGSIVTFGLFDSHPATMEVSAGNWGMLVLLGADIVLRYRGAIEAVLDSAGIEHDTDPYIGWNPVVVARVAERRVEAALVRGADLHGSHVRVSTTVTGGVSWNPDLSAEMNLWNDKWFDTKLIVTGNDLVVVRDVPVGCIDDLPSVVSDVVDKSLNLYDVVGVFL